MATRKIYYNKKAALLRQPLFYECQRNLPGAQIQAQSFLTYLRSADIEYYWGGRKYLKIVQMKTLNKNSLKFFSKNLCYFICTRYLCTPN